MRKKKKSILDWEEGGEQEGGGLGRGKGSSGGEGQPEGVCCEVKVPVCGVRWPPARGRGTLQLSAGQS